MNSMDIDDLICVLTDSGLTPTRVKTEGDYLFERHITFTIRDTTYHIEWWVNGSYLTIGAEYENYIRFTDVRRDTCWPSYLRGLKFSEDGRDVAAVAIDRLPWQELAVTP